MPFRKKISTPQQNIERTTQDIRVANGEKILNLKRRKRLYFASGTIFAAILLFSGAWLFYALKIKAEVAQFYPSSCLGGWKNAYNAQGKANLNEGAEFKEFNKNNSAVLQNAISELYCGNFEGEAPQDAELKQATLKFSWAITTEKFEETTEIEFTDPGFPTITIPEIGSTSQESPATPENAPNIIPPAEENAAPIPENNSVPEPPAPASFLPLTINIAFAQEETTQEIPASPAQETPQPEEIPQAPEETIIQNQENQEQEIPIQESQTEPIEQVSTSSATEIPEAVTSSPPESPIPPPTDFLEILYTLDGTNWQSLGNVNLDNWQNLSFEIPNFQWEDLSKIQILLKSVSTNDIPITIYLDGLGIEIDYVEEEALDEIEEESLLFGDLPVFDKNKFNLDKLPTHSCEFAPFSQSISPKQQIKFKLALNPTDKTKPYRLTLGDLPLGIKGGLKQIKNQDEIIVKLKSNASPQRGSFGIVIIYQELKNRKLFSANEVSITVCQFNLIILPAPEIKSSNSPNNLTPIAPEPTNTATTSETITATTTIE